MATKEDYTLKLAEVKEYMRHYGYTVCGRNSLSSYALFSRELDYRGRHTHVTIEVTITETGDIYYEVGAIVPETFIKITAGKTTNAKLVWRYAEQIHRIVTATKLRAQLDLVGSAEDSEPDWRVHNA